MLRARHMIRTHADDLLCAQMSTAWSSFCAQNSIEVDAVTKESTNKTEEKLDGRNKEGHERKKNLNEGQWEDRKQWSLGVGQRRKTFWTRYIHTY